MAGLHLSKQVAASVDEVWAAITDLEGSVDTISGIINVERLGGPEHFGVGTRWRETRKLFGKEATEDMEVTAIEPQRSYTVRADSHNVHYVSRLSVEPAGDGTQLSMTFDAEPQGALAKFMAATVGRLMRGATRKALQQDLDDIARAVEA